ncbi:alpha/beta fold hydrolase [Pseudonocardia spinosispora]|uniref:alpha/beta fold hydrolase n=1 Tax=Pseudonocardia spinosispora TaxID=103441 RepID=UPI000687FA90|nr:alpha/beta hydrolase [Pseudonocardia spinosispora]
MICLALPPPGPADSHEADEFSDALSTSSGFPGPSRNYMAVIAALTTSMLSIAPSAAASAYRSFGNGPILLMTPCMGFTMDDWDPALLDRLATTNHVVIFDPDGVGRTPASPSPIVTVPQLSDQAADLIHALHLNRPTIVGYSLGGFVAQRLAVDHPNDVSSLILMGTGPDGTQQVLRSKPIKNLPALNPLVPADQVIPLYFSGHPEALAAWRQRTDQRPNRVKEDLHGLNRQRAAMDDWLLNPTANVNSSLPTLRVPTLILGAENDEQEPAANSTLLHHYINGSELLIYPGLSHAFPFEAPGPIAERIARFTR